MARKPRQDTEEKVRLVEAPEFRTMTIDGAVVNQISDNVATTIQVIFTRFKRDVIAEYVEHETGEIGEGLKGTGRFESELYRVKECAALMRPDQAFAVAVAILQNLSRLSPARLARYNLPEQLQLEFVDTNKPAAEAPQQSASRKNANDRGKTRRQRTPRKAN